METSNELMQTSGYLEGVWTLEQVTKIHKYKDEVFEIETSNASMRFNNNDGGYTHSR